MTLMTKFLGAAAAMALSAGAALAEPALIYDLGGKFDKSFNEAAFNGATKWAEENGGSFRDIELQSEAQREQALRRFADAGANPIVVVLSAAPWSFLLLPILVGTLAIVALGTIYHRLITGHPYVVLPRKS